MCRSIQILNEYLSFNYVSSNNTSTGVLSPCTGAKGGKEAVNQTEQLLASYWHPPHCLFESSFHVFVVLCFINILWLNLYLTIPTPPTPPPPPRCMATSSTCRRTSSSSTPPRPAASPTSTCGRWPSASAWAPGSTSSCPPRTSRTRRASSSCGSSPRRRTPQSEWVGAGREAAGGKLGGLRGGGRVHSVETVTRVC